ncbi:Aste57867_23699 [Aphanomyces stellatus]|uniref:Aste57867_23699 protein n=1 Tax=Aphanomyces stellatus TaxID=120398 RepID=A0A485LSV8_9STRA|nr:hypothetical protein As57867_023627 [Aphanomyces stellatus]VFU00344.1 Aste57867_23699 [Aphanomyces stellatus]
MTLQYLLVLDFEATCSPSLPRADMEIIEFPIVVVDLASASVVAEFHSYVQPTLGRLDPFCTQLTGIAQATVDAAPSFASVWADARAFCAPFVADGLFVTCGDWDLRTMLPTQLARSGLEPASEFLRWANIKAAFLAWRGRRVRGMTELLDALGLPLVGRHHSGIADARNIAAAAVQMLQGGHEWAPTNFRTRRTRRQK